MTNNQSPTPQDFYCVVKVCAKCGQQRGMRPSETFCSECRPQDKGKELKELSECRDEKCHCRCSNEIERLTSDLSAVEKLFSESREENETLQAKIIDLESDLSAAKEELTQKDFLFVTEKERSDIFKNGLELARVQISALESEVKELRKDASVEVASELLTENRQLEKEVEEQCRLNGMGQQREAKLLTERDFYLNLAAKWMQRAEIETGEGIDRGFNAYKKIAQDMFEEVGKPYLPR